MEMTSHYASKIQLNIVLQDLKDCLLESKKRTAKLKEELAKSEGRLFGLVDAIDTIEYRLIMLEKEEQREV